MAKAKKRIEENSHLVEVSDKSIKMLKVLKNIYKQEESFIVEESLLDSLKRTPFGLAQLNVELDNGNSN